MAKKKKGDAAAAAPASGAHHLALAGHPRASAQIRRAKAWGGIAAFLITLWLSHRAGLPLDAALERALPAVVVGYVLAWVLAVVAWRQLAQAEIEVARRKIAARVAELQAEADSR